MESHHSLSSGDSSPRSREINCDSNNNSSSWDEPSPAATAAAKVKLMCSYGGRIQPRHHDNKLSYVGGETKILAVDRFIRFPSFKALLPSSTSDDVCIKYQLPGEDLDSLISVTNDEDLEHMMLEYDRLLRPAAPRPAPRLRLFLFPISNKQPDRHWFVEPLNSAPLLDPVTSPPPPGSDFLFGLDKDFVPPPAVKVKDPAPEMEPPLSVEVPAKEDRPFGGGDSAAAVSPAEIQRQIQELQRMQIAAENQEIQRMQIAAAGNQEFQRMQIAAPGNQEMQRIQIAVAGNQELQRMQVAAENQELQQRMQIAAENNQHQQQAVAGFQRNSSDDALASRVLTTGEDYYMPRAPENTAAQIPAGYWAEQRMAAAPAPSRYASVVGGGGGEHPLYMIPGPYPGGAAYYAAVPRMLPPAEAYREGAAAMYAMGHQPTPPPSASLAGGGPLGATQQQGGGEGYTVAYDSAGRAVYYTGSVIPGAYHHQTVTSSVNPVGVVEGSKIAKKTPQVS